MITDFPLPYYPGWRKLSYEETIKEGDRFVRVNEAPPKSPAGGSDASGSCGHTMRSVIDNNRRFYNNGKFPYWIYRKGSEPSIPRRLIGSRMTTPLPLP